MLPLGALKIEVSCNSAGQNQNSAYVRKGGPLGGPGPPKALALGPRFATIPTLGGLGARLGSLVPTLLWQVRLTWAHGPLYPGTFPLKGHPGIPKRLPNAPSRVPETPSVHKMGAPKSQKI